MPSRLMGETPMLRKLRVEMTHLLIDIGYLLLLIVASPLWLYRMIRHGRYRRNLAQRLGAAPVRYGLQPTIWAVGVSVGEIKAAQMLVRELHSQLPDYRVVISSWTDAGLDEARRLYEPDHLVFARPLDFSLAVGRALDRIRPSLVVFVEGDIWPNFLGACNKRGIPVAVINGRMSPKKGYPRYRMLGPLAPRLLFNRLSAIGVQDETYADCYRKLGTHADKVHVTGMIKFDRGVSDRVDGQDELAAAMGISSGDQLIVAGGTGDGEEAMVLEAFKQVRAKHPRAKLAIIPRKPERFDEVARQIAASRFEVVRRTQRTTAGDSVDPQAVLLGDTMGELRKYYPLASAVFVGRSLVPMGGSDMIEPAALGAATCFGPHTYNFPQAAELVKHGCVRVNDVASLAATLDGWLSDAASATAAGKSAQQFVAAQQGATRRNVEMLCGLLGRVPAVAEGGIATDEIHSTPASTGG